MALEYNPLLREHQLDPYPVYRVLRSEDPVHFSELFQGWVLSRHADVAAVLRDPRFSVDRSNAEVIRGTPLPPVREELRDLAEALKRNMLFTDPPDHTRLRTLVAKAFTPRAVEAHRAHIQQIVDAWFDAVAPAGRMDFMRDVADPLPVIVVAEVLGLPPADRRAFKRWAEDIGASLDPWVSPDAFDRAQDSALEMYQYFQTVFAERRAHPHDDLISALVAAEQRGDVRSEYELFANCALILGAGHQTTTNFLGNAVLALAQHPDERRRLTDDPSLIGTAVEEFLRYDSPVQMTARLAKEPYRIDGKVIAENDFVVLLLGAANRDPAEFPAPDRLDVSRRENRHLAFSFGPHACVGALLARLQGSIVITTLLRRFPRFRLEDERPDWKPMVMSRGLNSLSLTW